MPVTQAEFRGGLRLLTSGVCLITTGSTPRRGGLVATAVMSLTADPPQIVIGVNQGASAYPLIAANGHFVVNILAEHDTGVAEVFAGKTGLSGDARFAGESWGELHTGSPVRRGAIVSLDCRVVKEMPVDTHSLFVGSVEAIETSESAKPLLHFDGKWAALQTAGAR